jgi:hypothetical protein
MNNFSLLKFLKTDVIYYTRGAKSENMGSSEKRCTNEYAFAKQHY